MNSTAPWSIKALGFDTREAARDAARRSGLSLGDWLDDIISERASELGIAKADVDADERLAAVAAKLSRFVERAAAEPDEDPPERGRADAVQQEKSTAHAAADGPSGWRGRAAPQPRLHAAERAELQDTLFDPLVRDFRSTQTAIADFRDRVAQTAASGPGGAHDRRTKPGRRFDERSVRDAVAEIARRQADLDAAAPPHRAGASDGAVTPPSRQDQPMGAAPQAAGAPAQAVPGRGYSLNDMNEAVTALAARMDQDNGAGRPPSGPVQRGETQQERRSETAETRAPWDDDFGAMRRSFDKLAQDMRQAIENIDPRASVETLDREVRAIGRKVDTMSVGIPNERAIHRIGVQTQEMRDILTAAASRPPMIGNVERQIAKLESRMAQLADAPREPALGGEQVLNEVRAMLERFRPGSGVEILERRIEELSSKIDHELVSASPSSVIGRLTDRIEQIHGSLRAEIAAPSVDTKPLESLVRGIAERIEEARAASSDFQKLEVMMRDLAAKFEAGRTEPDFRAVQALESQITRLGDRLDRSEASLKTLDSVERSLGELFNQLTETRHAAVDAAENAARVAARDTLRAAMHGQGAMPRQAEAAPGLVEQVSQGIADLRSMHDASEQRTQATLSGLSRMIEQLVDSLARQAVQEVRAGAAAPSASESAAGPRPIEPAATSARSDKAEPARRRRGEPAPVGVVDPSDMLIEPGSGRAPLRTAGRAEAAPEAPPAGVAPGVAPPNPGDIEGPAAFIAAARRAAQAAQASAAAASSAKPQSKARPASTRGPETALSTIERARSFLAHRRRPILLSLAGLVLLLGALEVFKFTVQRGPSEEATDKAEIAAPQVPDVAQAEKTLTPDQLNVGREAAAPAAAGNALAPVPTITAASQPNAVPVAGAGKPRAAGDADNRAGAVKADPLPRPPLLAAQPNLGADPVAGGIGEGLRDRAAAGDKAAEFEVALRYVEGRGVARDPKLAAQWFQKAANQGLVPAEYRLGSAYEKGVGVARDPVLAMAWYGRAAEAGNIRAMHNLAVMAAEGAAGKPDYARAASWFQRAASLGVRDSQFNLAILYARGLGIEQSLAQSYTWFAVAAAQGDDDAAKKRDEVASRLDAKSLAAAKAAADNFHPSAGDPAANDVPAPPGGWDAVAPMRQAPTGGKGVAPRVSAM